MKTHWVIEDIIDNTVNGTVKEALVDLNIPHSTVKYVHIPSAVHQEIPNISIVDQPIVVYATINYISKIRMPWAPGAYGWHNMNCIDYYSQLPNEMLLNGSYIMIPFYKIKDALNLLGWNDAFIRPNSGRKTFTGFTITKENVEQEMKSSLALTSVTPQTICLMSPAVNINAEFRFVVGNKRVIDGSEYRWDKKLDIRHDWDPDAYKLAEKVVNLQWQPDNVYVVDVALTAEGPKVVELNSFCSAGLYAMDKKKVVAEVSEIAYKEFYGEI